MKDKKVCFMGTPEFAVPVLEALIKNTDVVLVVTQPDKQVGRKKEIRFSKVKECALKNNIPIFQPTKIKNEYETILECNPDIIITCAYGQIIPDVLLDTPKYKAINVHASLLPKLRGGAPIHKAIIYGYEKTGITIMYMSNKMDAGDIIAQEQTVITIDDNVGSLHDRLSLMGASLLLKTLPSIFERTNKRIVQDDEEATFAYNVTREEEHIDFNKTALEIYNQIRGLYPFPIANFILDDKEYKVISAYIGEKVNTEPGVITNIYKEGIGISSKDKEIVITRLKPEGKKEMSAVDFINGIKDNLIGKKIK